MTIHLSLKQLGAEIFRRLLSFWMLNIFVISVNSLLFLWPDVFKIPSTARSLISAVYVLCTLGVFILLHKKNRSSVWEYGISLVCIALFMSRWIETFSSGFAELLERRGASIDFILATVGTGSHIVEFWVQLELIAFALSKTPQILSLIKSKKLSKKAAW